MPDIFVSHFPRKVPINNYRFQPLVVSATLFHPVWRGLDNIRSNPWSTRDTSCSTWETKITASCRSNCHSSPCVEMHKINIHSHASPIRVMKLQWFRRQGQRWRYCCCGCYYSSLSRLKTLRPIFILRSPAPRQWDTVVLKTETKT